MREREREREGLMMVAVATAGLPERRPVEALDPSVVAHQIHRR